MLKLFLKIRFSILRHSRHKGLDNLVGGVYHQVVALASAPKCFRKSISPAARQGEFDVKTISQNTPLHTLPPQGQES